MILRRLTIIITFLTAWVWSNGQQINAVPDYVFRNQMSVGRNAVTDTAAYFSIGPRYGATRGMMPPMVVDTASFSANKRNGLLIFSVQKNKFLYWDSVRVQWSDMAGSSGSYITGTLTNNYIPKATSSTTLGNSVMYDSSGHVRVYGNYVGNTNPNRLLFTSEISGNNGYTALFKQSDSITDAGQFPLILRKGLLTTDKPRPNFGVGLETQLQDDAGTWRRSGFVVNRIVDSTAANFRTKFDFRLINGSTYPIPLIVSGDSSIRMAKLAGSGTRYVVADANGDLSATSETALVDTTTISTRAWRQKGLDSLAALEVSGSGTTNYVAKFTAGSTIGNSQIFDNGTNVGIGTASPLSKLQVSGETVITNGSPTSTQNGLHLFFDTNVGYITSEQPGTTFRELRVQGSPLIAQTAGTERLRITSGGDVGIGTTTPSLYSLGGYKYLTLSNTTSNQYAGIIAAGQGVGGGELLLGNQTVLHGIVGSINGSALAFYTNGANSGTSVSERLRIFANGRVFIGASPTDAGYQLDVNGTLRSVNGANFATTSGNVGIGTASPVGDGTALNIYGSSFATIKLQNSTSGATATDGTDILIASSDLLIKNRESGSIITYTANTERGRINAAGEWILNADGTDAGDYKLQVSGNIYNTGSAVLAATSGIVGIGTTSPTALASTSGLLHVNGASTNSELHLTNTSTGATATDGGLLLQFGTRTLLYNLENSSLEFGTNNTERGRINSAGEWIIDASGTDAGNYKLQVFGQAFIRNTATSGALYLDSTSLSIYEVKNRHAILISGHSLTGAEIQGPIYVGTNWNTSSDVSAIEVALTNTASGANSNLMKLSDGTNTFRVTKDAEVVTAAPTGGSIRKWKLGEAATVSPTSPNRTIRVEIDGTVYYLHAKTTND